MQTGFGVAPRLLCSVFSACVLLLLFSSVACAVGIDLKSETFIRSFEREISPGEGEKNVSPFYAYLRLDARQLNSNKLSFHAYGWGRSDLSDSEYFEDRSEGELIYAYLEYADSFQGRRVRLGRQHVFEGVANESIDGLSLSSDLGNQFSMSAYGGLPVGLEETEGRGGDGIFGGRLSHHFRGLSNIGLSYKKIDNDDTIATSMLGLDTAFFLPMNISLYGNSVRNMETEGWAEHVYEVILNLGDLNIRPYYEMFNYDDYFDAGAQTPGPFISLINSDEQLETVGVDLAWRQSQSWTLGAKAKNYSYELSETSKYLAVLLTWYGDDATQVGGEIGSMLGDAADNDYNLLRLFFYFDQLSGSIWLDFISGDILYTLYDQDVYGKDTASFLSLGSGKMFLDDDLSIKLSAGYSEDPYFDNDLRSMLTVSYRFGAGF